jgi:hypothetical protein
MVWYPPICLVERQSTELVKVGDDRYVVRIGPCSVRQVAHVVRESDVECEHQDALSSSSTSSSAMSENKALAGPRDAAQAPPALCGLGVTSLLWCQLAPPVLLKVPRGIQPRGKALGPMRPHDS